MDTNLAPTGLRPHSPLRARGAFLGLALATLAAGCSRSFDNPSTAVSTTPQFGAIQGVVQLSGGGHDYSTLLPNVDVALTEPNGIQLHNQVNAQGLFTIGSLPAGTYAVLVTVNAAPGQSQLFAPFSVSPIAVTAGKTTNLATLNPSYTGSSAQVRLDGFVRTDFHGDAGAFSFDGGYDLTGTRVDLFFAGDDTAPYLTTFTDSAGNFGYLLPAGTYDLKATNTLFVPGTELAVPVGITPDGGVLTGLQTLPQPIVLALNPARLAGVVTEELDINLVDAGAGDGGGFVPAASVGVSTDFGGVGLTGADGTFTINNLLGEPDELHLAAATGMGGDTYHAEFNAYDVTLYPGELTTVDPVKEPLRLLLDRGTITGKVQTADGSSVASATVSLAFTSLAATVSPEGNPSIGDFSIANVPVRPGYTVNVAAPHFISTTASVPASFAGDGAVVDVGTIVIAPQQGDFTILSTNPASKAGYTNALAVDIQLDGAPSGATQIRIAESSSFGATDGGTVPWTSLVTTSPYNPFTLSDHDGAHTVYAQYQTPASNGQPANPGPLLTGSVFVDRVRPVNPSITVNGGEFQKIATGIALSLSASDGTGQSGLASMLVTQAFTGADYDGGVLAGTPGAYSISGSFPPSGPQLADGLYTAYAQFFDNAGNASAIVAAPVVVDTVIPTGSLSITSLTASDPGYTSSALVVLNEMFGWPDGGLSSTTTEPFGGIETVRLANEASGTTPSSVGGPIVPASASQTWALDTSSGDGPKQVAMQIVDAAGNVSSVVQATITLLRTAPAGSVTILASSTGGPASVNPAATDQAHLKLQYSLPSTATNPGATGVEVSEAPVACSSIPASQYTRVTGSPMTLSYTFAGSSPDGGGIEDGNKVLFSCLRNAAGTTTQLENQIELNRQAPSATVTVGDGSSFQNDGTTTTIDLSGASSDVVGVEVSTSPLDCDGGTYQPFIPADPIVQVSTPTDGQYTVYLCLQDSAGNETALGPYTFTRDTASPAIVSGTWSGLSNPAASATNVPTAQVNLSVGSFGSVTPPAPVVVGYRLSTDQTFNHGTQPFQDFAPGGTPVTGPQNPFSFSFPSDGGNAVEQVYAQVIDLAGNLSTPATALPPVTLIQLSPTATTDVYVGTTKNPAATNQANVRLQFTVSANVNQVAVSNTPLECGPESAWQALVGSPPSLAYTLPGGGSPPVLDSIYTCFEDLAGNTVGTVNSITLDTQDPTGAVTIGDGASFQNDGTTTSVTLSGFSSNIVGIAASTSPLDCDAGPYQTFLPSDPIVQVPTPTDGDYTVYVCVEDNAGNISSIGPTTFTRDTASPAITSATWADLSNDPANATDSLTAGVDLSVGSFSAVSPAVPIVVGYRLSTDQTFGAGSQPFLNFNAGDSPVSGPQGTVPFSFSADAGDGTQQVYAQVIDLAGNLSTPATALPAVKLIQTQPTATTDIYVGATKDPASTDQASVTLQFTVSANVTQVVASSTPLQCSTLPSSSWQSLSGSPPTLPFTLQGSGSPALQQSIYVCFRDPADNYASTANTITYSTVAPTATMLVGNGAAVQNVSGNVPIVFSNFASDPTGIVGVAVSTASLTCSSATYTAFNPASPSTSVNVGSTPATDGPYTIHACVKDGAGNTTALPNFSFTKDTVAPTITAATLTGLSDTAGSATNSPSVVVDFTGFSESVATYRISTDSTFGGGTQGFADFSAGGGLVAAPQAIPFNLPATDGAYKVYAEVQDLAGNTSPSTLIQQVTLLQAVPAATTDIYVGAVKDPAATNQANVTLQFTVSANLIQVFASSTQQTCGSIPAGSWQNLSGAPPTVPFTLSGTGNPSQVESIFVCFRDAADNYASTINSITFDTQAPVASMLVGNGAPVQNVSGNVPVVFSGFTANITGVVASTGALNCATATYSAFNPSSPVTSVNVGTTPATDGPYTVSACLKDSAGNTYAVTPFSFTKDTVNPTGTIAITGFSPTNQPLSNGYTASPNVQLTLTSSVTTGKMQISNLASFSGAAWQPFQTPLAWTLPTGAGSKTVYVQYQDLAGNVSSTVSATITLDTSAPANPSLSYVASVAPPANCTPPSGTINNATIKVTAAATPPTGTIDLSDTSSFSDGSTQLGLGSSISNQAFTFQAGDGPKTLFARFTDPAGNSTMTSLSLVLDTTPPTSPTLSIVQAPYTNSATVTVNLSAVGAPASVSIAASEANGAHTTNTTTIAFTGSTTVAVPNDVNGTKTLTATFFDQACNSVVAAPATTYLDTQLPTGTISVLGTLGDGSTSAALTSTPTVSLTLSASDPVGADSVQQMEISEDPAFGSASWKPYATSATWSLSSGDGTKTIYARFQNQAGSISTTASTSIQLLTTSTATATVTLTSIDSNALEGYVSSHAPASSQVTVSLSATGSPTQYELLNATAPDGGSTGAGWTNLPAGSGTWSLPTTTLPGATDGTIELYVFLRGQDLLETGPFIGSITRLVTAPTITALAFPSASTGYTSNRTVAVNATLTALSSPESTAANDRYRVSCDASQAIASQPWTSLQSQSATVMQASCVLLTPDGSKTVTIEAMDQAGNVGSPTANTVTLLQTLPVAPTLSLSSPATTLFTDATDGTTNVTSYSVTVTNSGTAFPSTSGVSGSTWEVTGGAARSVSGTTITFTLNSGTAVSDTGNSLAVSTIDAAGNVSQQTQFSMTQEILGDPAAPTNFQAFTRSGQVVLSWTGSVSAFTTYYTLDYGTSSSYGGTFASQGPSPINLGTPCSGTSCSVTLSGLTNETLIYVKVTPHSALQAGAAATLGPLTPQEASFSDLGGVNTRSTPAAIQVVDDRAYLVETGNPSPLSNPCLEIIDLANPAAPTSLGHVDLFSATFPNNGSLVVGWPYAYVGAGADIFIINLSNESAPTISATLATAGGGSVGGVDLVWPLLYANTTVNGVVELQVFNVSNPASIAKVTFTDGGYLVGQALGGGPVVVVGDSVFVGGGNTPFNDAGGGLSLEVAGTVVLYPDAGVASMSTSWSEQINTGDEVEALLVAPNETWNTFALGNQLTTINSTYADYYSYPAYGLEVQGGSGTVGSAMAFAGADVIVAGSSQLEVVDASNVADPFPAATATVSTVCAKAVAVSNDIAWIAGQNSSCTYYTGRLEAFQLTHPTYPVVEGTAPAGALLGGANFGSSHIENRGPVAMVGGSGLYEIDTTNPASPYVMAGPSDNNLIGGGYSENEFGGSVALDGQVALETAWTALVAYQVGTIDSSSCPEPYSGPNCQACAIGRHPAPSGYSYFGVDARGSYIFAGRTNYSTAYLDALKLPMVPASSCAADLLPDGGNDIGVVASTALTGQVPLDVRVHRHYAFVLEGYGSGSSLIEVYDVSTPTSPATRLVSQTLPSDGASGGGDFGQTLSVRLGTCSGVDCYQIYVAAIVANNPAAETGEVVAYTWVPGAGSMTQIGTIQLPGGPDGGSQPVFSVAVDYPSLIVGNFGSTSASLGYGVFDIATEPTFTFDATITPIGEGTEVMGVGAAGRFVYANMGGTFVVSELQ